MNLIERLRGSPPVEENTCLVEKLPVGNSLLEFSRDGGKILKLILKGKTILSKFERGDGKTGATHPCTPNFGPDGRNIKEKKKMAQHGFGRNSEWKKVETDEDGALKVRLEVDKKKYPEFKGLEIEQAFSLVDGELTIETTHTNRGKGRIPVNFGEHFYFNALDAGWENLEINGQPVADLVRQTGVIELKDINIISGLGVEDIILEQEGLSKAVLWVGIGKNGIGLDENYVCFEPVEGDPVQGDSSGFFGSEESMIEPNQSRKTVIKLSLED